MSPRFTDEKPEAEDQGRCQRQEPGDTLCPHTCSGLLARWARNVGNEIPKKPSVGKGGIDEVPEECREEKGLLPSPLGRVCGDCAGERRGSPASHV